MNSCLQSLICNGHVMMILIRPLQTDQNLNGFLLRWFLYHYRLKTTFKGRILLNMLPIFFNGRGTDNLQFTSGQ